jgi:hypothetical protein
LFDGLNRKLRLPFRFRAQGRGFCVAQQESSTGQEKLPHAAGIGKESGHLSDAGKVTPNKELIRPVNKTGFECGSGGEDHFYGTGRLPPWRGGREILWNDF